MKKNIRVNISISPSVLEDAKKIADNRFAGNVSAYIASLIDNDIKLRGVPQEPIQKNKKATIVKDSSVEGSIIGSKIKTKIKK